MSDKSDSDPIQAQYERWIYPPPISDLSTAPLARIDWHHNDVRALWSLYWPSAPFREDIDILVPGCGTLAAAAAAYLYPTARVVGIDVSRASLEHSKFLKQRHNLENLTLRHARLEDVASLDVVPSGGFDHIVCHGVLHHTPDPVKSLRSLGDVLRQDGVIDIMVYGKHGRCGVTMLQEVFRILNVQQDEAGIDFVRNTLAVLPPRHPVQHYRTIAAEDLANDAGIVDTFLSARDVPFTVADCLKLVDDAGLVFQGWKENGMYHVDFRLPANHPMRIRLEQLPEREMWQAVELIDAGNPGHWFHVCRRDRDKATYEIRFDGDAFLGYIPDSRVTHNEHMEPGRASPARIGRPPFPPVVLDSRQSLLLSKVDGKRTIRECLEAAEMPPAKKDNVEFARGFFRLLWHCGYAFFLLPRRT